MVWVSACSITLQINSFSKYRKAFWSCISIFYQKVFVAHFLLFILLLKLLFRKHRSWKLLKKPNKTHPPLYWCSRNTAASRWNHNGVPFFGEGQTTLQQLRFPFNIILRLVCARSRETKAAAGKTSHKRLVVKTLLHKFFKVLQTTDFYHFLSINLIFNL